MEDATRLDSFATPCCRRHGRLQVVLQLRYTVVQLAISRVCIQCCLQSLNGIHSVGTCSVASCGVGLAGVKSS